RRGGGGARAAAAGGDRDHPAAAQRIEGARAVKIPDFGLERFFARREFAVKHLMCASDCESMTVGELLGYATDSTAKLIDLKLGYTERAGHPALRTANAHLFEKIDYDHTLVFSGGQEPIFAFMNVA